MQGFVQQGGDSASLATGYAALCPRDGFSHSHHEHMKDTYILVPTVSVGYFCFGGLNLNHVYMSPTSIW